MDGTVLECREVKLGLFDVIDGVENYQMIGIIWRWGRERGKKETRDRERERERAQSDTLSPGRDGKKKQYGCAMNLIKATDKINISL